MDPFVEGVNVDVVGGNYEGQTGTVEGHTPRRVRVRLANGVQTLLASASLQVRARPSSVDRQEDQTATRSSQSQESASTGGEQGNGSSWRFGNPTNHTFSWAFVPAIRCALRLDTEDMYANTAVQAIGEEPFRAAVRALQVHLLGAQRTEVNVGNGGYIDRGEQNRVMGLIENTSDGQAFMLAASAAHKRATPRGRSHEAPTTSEQAGDQSEPSTSHHSRGNTAPKSYWTADHLAVLTPIAVALIGIAIAIAWSDVVSRPDVVNPRDMSAADVQDWFRTHDSGVWAKYGPAFAAISGAKLSAFTKEDFKDKIVATDTSVGTAIYNQWHAQDERARSRMTAADVQKWIKKDHKDGKWEEYAPAFGNLDGADLNQQTEAQFIKRVELANITPNYGSNIFNDWQLYCPVTSTMTAHNVTSWITDRGWHDYAPLFNMTGGELNQHTLSDIHQLLELKRARQDAPILYNDWGELVLRTSFATVALSVIAHPVVLGATVLAVFLAVYIWRRLSAVGLEQFRVYAQALASAECEQDENYLHFPGGCMGMRNDIEESLTRVFIRTCFVPLYARIVNVLNFDGRLDRARRRIFVMGTPGCGKSIFRNYVARQLVKWARGAGHTLVLVFQKGDDKGNTATFFACYAADGTMVSAKKFYNATETSRAIDDAQFRGDVVVSLVDVQGGNWRQCAPANFEIYFTSPHANLVGPNQDFDRTKEDRPALDFYMPLWTDHELDEARSVIFPSNLTESDGNHHHDDLLDFDDGHRPSWDLIQRRVSRFGYTARVAFPPSLSGVRQKFEMKLADHGREGFIADIFNHFAQGDGHVIAQASHSFVHVDVDDSYEKKNTTLVWASPYIKARVAEQVIRLNANAIRDVENDSHKNSGYRGELYESLLLLGSSYN
eukprot:m.401564 g.401564  ORF g.401564 m.401564 type:complete len:893 (-) comp16785_c1_seq45:1025-3703(-)